MSTYSENAYSAAEVAAAMKAAGFRGSFRHVVAKLSTKGMTLTAIAEKLGLNPQRFWAYYRQWCRDNIQPLRLNEET